MKLKNINNNNSTKHPIVVFLTKYYLSKGINFGSIVHSVAPKNIQEWKEYLITKKFYLPKNSILIKNNFSSNDHIEWIKYLISEFWNLYWSEIAAINYFKKSFDIKIEFINNFSLDRKYGIDFFFKNKYFPKEFNFVIVKTYIDESKANNYLKYKPLKDMKFKFENKLIDHRNSTIFLFSSKNEGFYVYKPEEDRISRIYF